MTMTTTLPAETETYPWDKANHFRLAAGVAVEVDGFPYRRFGGGGWTADGEGRKVYGGPEVAGPHAFLFGLATVLANTPQEQPRTIRVAIGDVVRFADATYRVERPGFLDNAPRLVLVDEEAVR